MNNSGESTDRSSSSPPAETLAWMTSSRSLKQLSLFCAGSTFFGLSMLITRRAITRRYAATVPHFYRPSNRPSPATFNGPLEAFEALSLATLNVTTFMMMIAGGTLWAFDISTRDELKQKIKRKLAVDENGGSKEAETELEEWLAGTLSMEDEKSKEGGAQEGDRKTQETGPR